MSDKPLQNKARRRMNRRQIQEIIERNIELYKDEDSFSSYLVELAIYLLEYEYDWDESDAERPQSLPVHPEEGRPVSGVVVKENDTKVYHKISPSIQTKHDLECPHCGAAIKENTLICPNCRNLAR